MTIQKSKCVCSQLLLSWNISKGSDRVRCSIAHFVLPFNFSQKKPVNDPNPIARDIPPNEQSNVFLIFIERFRQQQQAKDESLTHPVITERADEIPTCT